MAAAGEHQTVGQHGGGLLFHVLGDDEIAPVHGGADLAGPVEGEGAAGGDAGCEQGRGAGVLHNVHQIARDVVIHGDPGKAPAQGEQLLRGDDLRQLGQQLLGVCPDSIKKS